MITINLIELLTAINTIILVGACIFYFKKNYVIIEKETWDSAVEVCEEYTKEHQETNEELAGGEGIQVGFGADYLEDDEEEEE